MGSESREKDTMLYNPCWWNTGGILQALKL